MTCPAMLAIMAQAGPGSNYSFHVAKMRLESHAREGCSRRSRGTNTCAFPYAHAFTLRAARSMRLAQATRRSRLFGEPLIPYDGHGGTHCLRRAFHCRGTHSDKEAFMPRIAIVGLACSTFLILLSSSAVPQEARAGADTGSGQLIFNNACRTCPTTKEGDDRLGPNLHNIIGRKAGSLPTFGYSSAMKGADFVWNKEKLDGFIAKPDEVVPGNNMKPYGGLASAEDRTKLITFLQSPTVD